ncbi:MAG TPA: conjugal transfer protein TraL [Oscillospiraceae bacterium]|nr:conjugal transfer protein TraL [Oscillospiraceae bacterium]
MPKFEFFSRRTALLVGGFGLFLTACLLLGTGAALLGLTRLSAGGKSAWPVLLPVFLLFFLAATFLPRLLLRDAPASLPLFCAPFAALSVYVRAAVLEGITYDYTSFLSHWAAFFREYGFAGLGSAVGDYNMPYLYFMALFAKIPVNDLYLVKTLSILFDLILAWGGMLLCARLQEGGFRLSPAGGHRGQGADFVRPAAVFFGLLLLPTVVFNGALWGQCDSIYAAFLVFSLYFALRGNGPASVVLAGLAFSFKLQSVFLLPILGAFWLVGRLRFRTLFLFPLTYLATCLPALAAGKPLSEILGIYVGQMGTYSYSLSLNAPSLLSFLTNSDVNISFWSALSIFIAFAFVLALLALLWLRRARAGDEALFLAALALAVGVPLLLPYMHERYFFAADVLTLVYAALRLDRFFVAGLSQVASLGGYHAYLVLRYAFPMPLGALFLLFALGVVLRDLLRSTGGDTVPASGAPREIAIDNATPHGYND